MADTVPPAMPDPEFSRVYFQRSLPAKPVHVAAEPGEREALAKRFLLEAIDRLEADVTLDPDGGEIVAKGTLSAAIRQTCSISGEPFDSQIDVPIDLRFSEDWDAPPGCAATDEDTQETGFALNEDALDLMPLTNGQFDVGEAVAQSLALELDPYPEGPNADAIRAKGVLDEPERESPFAALKALKK